MALLVCCPCGNPIDCERIEIVVTLACPACQRELLLELENERRGRYRAFLTIMEGPFWVGERFVMPVGQDLLIGKAGGNWLSLDGDDLSDKHCRLKLTAHGTIQIEDLDSANGTWIGAARISRGKLKPTDSFKVGEYRLRVDYQGVISGEIVSQSVDELSSSGFLPDLKSMDGARSTFAKLTARRFVAARQLILIFAWCMAGYHFFELHAPPYRWEWYWTFITAIAMLVPILIAGGRVALLHPILKYGVIVVLATSAVADLAVWNLSLPAIGALVLAASLPLITVDEPSVARAVTGIILGAGAAIYMGISALVAASAVWE